MLIRNRLRLLLAVLAAVSLVGCGAIRDRRDAPWDPKHPSQMLEQIPNWDGEANRRCGGHLTAEEAIKQGRSQRC